MGIVALLLWLFLGYVLYTRLIKQVLFIRRLKSQGIPVLKKWLPFVNHLYRAIQNLSHPRQEVPPVTLSIDDYGLDSKPKMYGLVLGEMMIHLADP